MEAPRQDNAPVNQSTPELDIPPPTPLDTPLSERRNPSYRPADSPRSRKELLSARDEPPLTRPRTQSIRQDHADTETKHAKSQELFFRLFGRVCVNVVRKSGIWNVILWKTLLQITERGSGRSTLTGKANDLKLKVSSYPPA